MWIKRDQLAWKSCRGEVDIFFCQDQQKGCERQGDPLLHRWRDFASFRIWVGSWRPLKVKEDSKGLKIDGDQGIDRPFTFWLKIFTMDCVEYQRYWVSLSDSLSLWERFLKLFSWNNQKNITVVFDFRLKINLSFVQWFANCLSEGTNGLPSKIFHENDPGYSMFLQKT